MREQVEALIENLGLEALEGEGGYFRRIHTFYSEQGNPSGSTILYLMTHDDFSTLHRLDSDEVWYLLEGSDVEQLTIAEDGSYELAILGRAGEGKAASAVVRAGLWQASRPVEEGGWSLCAAMMVPPWNEEGFALADEALIASWDSCPHLSRFVKDGQL